MYSTIRGQFDDDECEFSAYFDEFERAANHAAWWVIASNLRIIPSSILLDLRRIERCFLDNSLAGNGSMQCFAMRYYVHKWHQVRFLIATL